jgi:N-acylneuraminate cytidylyltransferase
LKAVVPAKGASTRVPEKNFRPFAGQKSLVDVTLEKLKCVLHPPDIFLSSEDPQRAELAARHGVGFLHRSTHLADNKTPLVDVIQGVCAQVPGSDDVMWAQVIDPNFDQYAECLALWRQIRDQHDSLVVVYKEQGYFLDSNHIPIGFGFGRWHIPSQNLPDLYRLPFTLSILTRESIREVGYYVGARPYWFEASGLGIDIDTIEQFELASAVHTNGPARVG